MEFERLVEQFAGADVAAAVEAARQLAVMQRWAPRGARPLRRLGAALKRGDADAAWAELPALAATQRLGGTSAVPPWYPEVARRLLEAFPPREVLRRLEWLEGFRRAEWG